MRIILSLQAKEDEGAPGGEEEGVDAVEDAAVARDEMAGVFDSVAALEHGFEEVAPCG